MLHALSFIPSAFSLFEIVASIYGMYSPLIIKKQRQDDQDPSVKLVSLIIHGHLCLTFTL